MAPGRTTKRRKVSPPGDEDATNGASDFYSHAAEWDLEQDYEQRPRKLNKKEKERTRLPIKTSEGFQNVEASESEPEDDDSFLGTDDDEEMEDGDGGEDEAEESEDEAPKIPLKQQIIQAKEEIARAATLINEDPEEHISSFKTMSDMVDSGSHVAVKKLALASQAAIYKDVIPGYRIRPLSEEETSGKISKEVRKLRNYEQSLLSGYKHYIQTLLAFTKSSKDNPTDAGLKTVAINCACSLLLAVPHFNFRAELLRIIVNQLARKRVDEDFVKCRDTLQDVFSRDDDGSVSLEAVRLLSKMMKARDFKLHGTVLDTFLHLRLLREFSSKGSRDRVDRDNEEENTLGGKKMKQKKEFRTKKNRKLEKERKAVEKDMREADALVSHEARDKNQAETLKLVFGVYFRILKLRVPNLMGPVLEGLAKFAHMINQDFFGDLLEALKDLIGHAENDELNADDDNADDEDEEPITSPTSTTRDSTRESLLCTVTAFALLEGQDASKAAAALHLDLSFFIKHLYRSLYTLSINPDVEYNPNASNALRLPDPSSSQAAQQQQNIERKKKVNFQTPMVLLLRCLNASLISRANGLPPPVRLASFAKRLMTASLQVPEKSALATLALLNQVARHNARRISSLWYSEERKGDGMFHPYAADFEATNVFAGTVWEGELLKLHYCPEVRDAAAGVEKMIAARD
ncbi:hypothetical protein BDW74DRAFT_156994 [Aspergillus multicolor]|uniref:nuclear export protein Noc3 n=1 Tax=Aspergillus multicolor TaxID=41759 RepID=UPI003CCD1ACB